MRNLVGDGCRNQAGGRVDVDVRFAGQGYVNTGKSNGAHELRVDHRLRREHSSLQLWKIVHNIGIDANRILDQIDQEAAAAAAAGDDVLQNELALRYNDRLDRMVARQWLLAGVIVYSLLDAYVDAHFRDFDIEFKTDPALPGDESASMGARAGLRWSF
jgi:hypothetical protein